MLCANQIPIFEPGYGRCPRVLDAVEDANGRQKKRLFEKQRAALGGELKRTRVAIWGVAFKPNIDDMRDAPSLTLIESLLAAGASVTAHDPGCNR